MRAGATPGTTLGTLAREWLRIGGRLCASWRHASRSSAVSTETSARLPHLIEALAPLGMPDLQSTSRRSWFTRNRAAKCAALSTAVSTVNVAGLLLMHLAHQPAYAGPCPSHGPAPIQSAIFSTIPCSTAPACVGSVI
jgi:hypothetical protein